MAKGRHPKRQSERKKTARRSSPSKSRIPWSGLDRSEQISVVCNLFCDGKSYAEIADIINTRYTAHCTRESIYPIVKEAVSRGWMTYSPPTEQALKERLRRQYDHLKKVNVVHTSQFQDVAFRGADMLIGLLKELKQKGRQEAHIGFAGGHAMRKLAQTFAAMVKDSGDAVPNHLVLHALVAGFDVFEPTTDPNTFFTLFQETGPEKTHFDYVGLHAPPVIKCEQFDDLRKSEGIKQSFDCAPEIEIIVTSATNWSDEHSTFRKYMQKSEDCFDKLESAGCIGDMLWLPLGTNGPIKTKTKRRSMTLIELKDLPGFIRKGKSVLLVVGPCSRCNRPKSEILEVILNQRRNRLVTHLVADSLTIRDILN